MTPLEPLLERAESAAALDGIATAVGGAVQSVTGGRELKDALSGTWLGHPLHPALTDGVIGCLMGSSLLDLLGVDRTGRATRKLIRLGTILYLPTAMSGASDWADSQSVDPAVRRIGLIHAGSNAAALSLYRASLLGRRGGVGRRGRMLRWLGATALLAGGYLGGHLAYAKGVGPDQTAFDPGPAEWTEATVAGELHDGVPKRVVVGDMPVLLVRQGGEIRAVHDRCSHRGCSLAEGEIEGSVVTCGCHGSRFDLRSGAVLRGPATAPQPAFEVRERNGSLELRLLARG